MPLRNLVFNPPIFTKFVSLNNFLRVPNTEFLQNRIKIAQNIRKKSNDACTCNVVFTASTFVQRAMLNDSTRKCSLRNVAQTFQGIRKVRVEIHARLSATVTGQPSTELTVTGQLFTELTVTWQLLT
jgi:hypothetical protein